MNTTQKAELPATSWFLVALLGMAMGVISIVLATQKVELTDDGVASYSGFYSDCGSVLDPEYFVTTAERSSRNRWCSNELGTRGQTSIQLALVGTTLFLGATIVSRQRRRCQKCFKTTNLFKSIKADPLFCFSCGSDLKSNEASGNALLVLPILGALVPTANINYHILDSIINGVIWLVISIFIRNLLINRKKRLEERVTCESCGSKADPSSQFCSKCGQKIAASD